MDTPIPRLYLYRNNVQKFIRPHRAGCTFCNHGQGYREDNPVGYERIRDAWIGPLEPDEANALVAVIAPKGYELRESKCCGVRLKKVGGPIAA